MSLKFILFVAFFIWSFPVWKYRSDFRKMAYKTDDWKINIQPRFITETKVLLGIEKREGEEALKAIRFYRIYLFVYFILLGAFFYV